MKLKVKTSILRGNVRLNEGDKIDLPADIANNWIKKGFAEKISKKQNKDSIETKELKVEHIEIKGDDGNKD